MLTFVSLKKRTSLLYQHFHVTCQNSFECVLIEISPIAMKYCTSWHYRCGYNCDDIFFIQEYLSCKI